ncbi:MAG: hypothetical protein DVB22_002969 [Verrucomicrobia bacterium]|jgi:hypothetical protein|nr:MAG: hypothetical protein DVB22_002969 [Verrucomicrobiota bacterium]
MMLALPGVTSQELRVNHQPAREKELFNVASAMHLSAAGGATGIDWRAMPHAGRSHAPERSPSVSLLLMNVETKCLSPFRADA